MTFVFCIKLKQKKREWIVIKQMKITIELQFHLRILNFSNWKAIFMKWTN